MFRYKRKNNFTKTAEEELKHDKVYGPKGHDDPHVCIDLRYDFKGHGKLYGRCHLVYDPKVTGVIRGRHDLLYDPNGSV